MSVTQQHQDDILNHWLLLHHTPGLGSVRIKQLVDQEIDPRELTCGGVALHNNLRLPDKVRNFLNKPQWNLIDRDLNWANEKNHHIISIQSPLYPQLLREIADPPAVLYVQGDPEVLQYPQLAIVGSRNPSHYGRESAFEFARHLSQSGLVITSGLAIGIDSAGHRGALEGNGVTIAVMGTGLDRVYPAQNKSLAEQISQQGALVSEFSIGSGALAHHFPRRNRIISAISIGTLVVEAAVQSGSLITARQAMEQGREVFAIPGSIHNPLARGCHLLIRDGAKLVENSADILHELVPQIGKLKQYQNCSGQKYNENKRVDQHVENTNPNMLSGTIAQLFECIELQPVSIDTLVQRSQLTAESISSMLVELELGGYIKSSAGMYSRSLQE